ARSRRQAGAASLFQTVPARSQERLPGCTRGCGSCRTPVDAVRSDKDRRATGLAGVTSRAHRAGFRAYWRWRSRPRWGRPKISLELRRLIREMSLDNTLWGAPRIHGELLKLGFEVGQTTVAKYMAKRRRPPSQSWKTFLRNQAEGIAALDLFAAPTADLRMLFALVIVRIDRRLIVTTNVTARPTAEWIARQVTEAFPWDWAPKYLIRDRDGAYGHAFRRRLHAMGIRDRPTAPRSPWQNCYAERPLRVPRSCDRAG